MFNLSRTLAGLDSLTPVHTLPASGRTETDCRAELMLLYQVRRPSHLSVAHRIWQNSLKGTGDAPESSEKRLFTLWYPVRNAWKPCGSGSRKLTCTQI